MPQKEEIPNEVCKVERAGEPRELGGRRRPRLSALEIRLNRLSDEGLSVRQVLLLGGGEEPPRFVIVSLLRRRLWGRFAGYVIAIGIALGMGLLALLRRWFEGIIGLGM